MNERQHEPGLQPGPVASLDRLQRPVHREARRHQDGGVDARDEDGQVEGRQRPRLGVGVDDPDEEVGGEERAEEHRLRGDEEEHAEHGGVDPRALVRDRRAVVVRVCVRAHASTSAGSTTTCSTGTFASLCSRPTRSRLQPRGAALLREGGDEDRVDALVLNGVHRGRERIRVRDLPVRLDPLRTQPGQRLPQPPLRFRMLAPGRGRSAGRRSGSWRCSLPRAFSRMRSSSGSPSTVSFASTSTFSAPVRSATSETTCSTGRLAGDLADLVEQVAPAPARLRLRVGRDDQLVRLLDRDRVLHRGQRIVVDDVARGGDPRLAEARERPVEPPARRRAARVVVDDVALARLVHRRDHDHERVGRPRRASGLRRGARRRSASRSRPRGSCARVRALNARPPPRARSRRRLAAPRASRRARRTRTARRPPAGSRRS